MKKMITILFFVLFIILFLGGTTILKAGEKCKSHDDCVIKGCCPAICIHKTQKGRPCPNPNIECEISALPPEQICGCLDNKCQFSHELFLKYTDLKKQAIEVSVSDPEAAMTHCDQLHGNYIFECYAEVASGILPINTSEAIKVCDSIVGRYRDEISVGNECHSILALAVAEENPNLAIELCSRASAKKPPIPSSYSYRERCAQDIAVIIAKEDLQKAFKACEIEGFEAPSHCKFRAIETVKQIYKNDLYKTRELLIDPNICEIANFSGHYDDYYKSECKNLCSIIKARSLAKDRKPREALQYCDQFLSDKTLNNRNICYNEISMIIAEYDANMAKSICNKIPKGSINYADRYCGEYNRE